LRVPLSDLRPVIPAKAGIQKEFDTSAQTPYLDQYPPFMHYAASFQTIRDDFLARYSRD
jgi:hypothetical protein